MKTLLLTNGIIHSKYPVGTLGTWEVLPLAEKLLCAKTDVKETYCSTVEEQKN